MKELLEKLIELLQEYVLLLKSKKTPMTPNLQILSLAKEKLGTDFTSDMIVPDEVSCAFAVTTILHEQDPDIPVMDGTASLDAYMARSAKFERVYDPLGGIICIAPTGANLRPDIMPRGHVGIYLDEDRIASNDSITGLWTQNYTRETFRQRYYYKGGFPIHLYKKIL